jgi:2-keto-4-pentenoate hydratase/2-oxohepta-3-ene-1,7-dioic acid hydratase in catechol pathway
MPYFTLGYPDREMSLAIIEAIAPYADLIELGVPIIAYLRAHVHLAPGDLIATGTPTRLPGPLGPDRHLEPGDTVVAWIDGIGSLTTVVG